MSISPIAPAGALEAIAVAEVLTARALDAMGGKPVAAQSQPEPTPQGPPQPPAVIAAATLQAASQQGSSAPLFADLAAVVRSPGLPQPVVAAAQQVLALTTPLNPPPSAAGLKTALSQSGLLLEAHLAAGAAPAGDLKAALLNLQQALAAAVEEAPNPPPASTPQQPAPQTSGAQTPPPSSQQAVPLETALPDPVLQTPATPFAPVPAAFSEPAAHEEPESTPAATLLAAQAEAEPIANGSDIPSQALVPQGVYPPTTPQPVTAQQAAAQPLAPAPPYPEGPVRAQAPADPAAAIAAASASQAATAHRLLQDTGAALARQVLFQLASAPAAQHAGDPNNVRWLFELPMATPQGTAIAQFEIDRDGGEGGGQAQGGDSEKGWRARFSLDLGDMGPVHAQVSLGGGRAGVSLWAEKPETAQALRAGRGGLADDFKADAVEADVAVFLGQPPAPAPRAGRLLDQAL